MSYPTRKIVASLILLAFMVCWIIMVGSVGPIVSGWPKWAEMLFYVFAGIGWIIPNKPIFAWMNRDAPNQED
ncbi:DUF2842 domain-containing protein [Hyphomonas sp. UBA4494]|jgi:hypothetical protein|uniref:DUF2842 domain-containing protein n=1 Tax=Hyphomonas sp. UBA4494 TaxID=1946631 RepID=UPI0025B7A7C2|nr:DUF2842 domain-containing protein [Hyphomonas sp. UBA4494]